MKKWDSCDCGTFSRSRAQEALDSGFQPKQPDRRTSDAVLCFLCFCFEYWFQRAAGLQGFLTPDTLQILRLIKDFPNYLPLSTSSYGFEERNSSGLGSGGERPSMKSVWEEPGSWLPAALSLLSAFLQAIMANSLPSFITESNWKVISKYFSVRGCS